jgi:hypothetical protein
MPWAIGNGRLNTSPKLDAYTSIPSTLSSIAALLLSEGCLFSGKASSLDAAYSGLQILLRPFHLRPAPLSSVNRCRSRIFYLRLSLSTPLPEGMLRLSPGTASPFRVTPVVRPFLTEPGPGDMPSTTWALSAFCCLPLPSGGSAFRLTGAVPGLPP